MASVVARRITRWGRGGRTLLATVVLLASAGLAPASADEALLRIAVQNERPPFSFTDDDGKLQGFDVEIAQALCAVLEQRCTLIPLEFTDLIPGLEEGQIDAAVASISITEERLKKVDFTDKYYQAPNRFVARHGAVSDITPSGLAGKTIGVKRGTTHDRYLSDQYAGTAAIVRYGYLDEIFIDLALGRVDLALSDGITLTQSFLKTDLGAGFDLVGPPINDPQWFGRGEGIAVRKGNADLLARLNQGLRQILADGTYQEIRTKYFDHDIYGDAVAVAQPLGGAALARPSRALHVAVSQALPVGAQERPSMALVLLGPKNDNSWAEAADRALEAEAAKGSRTAFAESVPDADVARVMRDYVDQGFKVIVGHSFAYQYAVFEVAAEAL